MLEAGKKLQQRYRIEKQVGQGGMGSVYLATDERFHSTVAIKEAFFADENYRKAFAREARLLNSLKHSALPKVTDHFVEDNGQYIVMEYIGGDDLFEMLRKSGRPFPVEDVMEWTGQLLDALSYLHDQGIIHRDIKPQNLKLTSQGNVILLDFGLAKGNPTDANYQTAAQSIFGYSRNYASLEQIQGTGTDPRSDVYSLAATIYHLMTARVPADALTRVMKVLNENEDPLEPAGLFNPEISQEVSDGLSRCLALKANSRPEGAEEMRSMLFAESSTKFTAPAVMETAKIGNLDVSEKNTLLAAERPDSGPLKQSEVKTEVIGGAAADSVQTLVANAETKREPGSRNTVGGAKRFNWGMAAAGLIIVGVIGTVAATVTFWPGTPDEVPAVESELLSEQPSPEALPTAELTSDEAPAIEESVVPAALPLERSAQTPKRAVIRAEPSPKVEAKVSAGKNEVTAEADGDRVRVTDSTVETDGVRIDQNRVEIRPTPPPPRPPTLRNLPITREQFDRLTPAQKLRLRQRIERERRLRNQQQKRPTSPPPR